MSQGHYSLIRCVPDPARGEAFNVGIVIWAGAEYRLAVDPAAAKRAAKENPFFARDALRSLESAVRSQIMKLGEFSHEGFERMRANQPGTLFIFADPCYVKIPDVGGGDAIQQAMERLVDRVVRPRSVEAVVRTVAEDPLNQALDLFIRTGRIIPHHSLVGGVTQQERPVSYYANHGTAVALDVLRLERRSAEAIGVWADAEAYKAYDLLQSNLLRRLYVFMSMSQHGTKQDANESARQTIESSGAAVVTTAQQAASVMVAAASGSSQ